jgi:hypothetical protein
MPKKKTDKKILPLEATFRDILVCEKSDLRPYVETFVQEPENITEAGLGRLAGIFEITDQSEDSSYIVNYLISVIKKEYYLKAKRGAVESLEAALRKANLALAKLAEHGNINWLGHLHAIIFVIEKNNVHLSQAGNARAFLLRGKVLADITDGQQAPDAPNPLKTFVDVLSGRLECDDRLIVTTGEIFDIFSLEEIKRSAIKFSPEEFTRFLHTALVNELERAAVLVVDLAEKEDAATSVPAGHRPKKLNAFSQQAFSKAARPERIAAAPETPIDSQEKQKLVSGLKDEVEKNNGNFVDKRTGHIYIKEDQFPYEETSKLSEIVENITAKTSGLGGKTFKNLGGWRKKLRGINWTGFFLEEENEDEGIPAGTVRPEDPATPAKNISPEEARSILSEVRAAESAETDKTSRYKNYFRTVRTSAAPIAQSTAAKIARAGGTALAGIKKAGRATAKFANQNSKKAAPIITENLKRFKPRKTSSAEKPGGRGKNIPPEKSSLVGAMLANVFGREKTNETFRSGENIAKKLGGRKLAELKANGAGRPRIKETPEPAAKPVRLDMLASKRPAPAGSERSSLNQARLALTEIPIEKPGTTSLSASASSNEMAEGPSGFVDSRRIGNLFVRGKRQAAGPLEISPEETIPARTEVIAPTLKEPRRDAAAALPSLEKIKSTASRFDYSQKLYAILAIIFLLVVPYFIVRWQNGRSRTNSVTRGQTSSPTQVQTQNAPASDASGGNFPALNSVYSGTNIARLINLNGKIFAVSAGQLADIQNKKTYPLPGSFGPAKISLGLPDLNLIFFINAKNQMLSWSPAAPAFQPETLTLPPNAVVSYAKTYLTYLYILDQNNNQIYRYPRTTAGFTDKTDWLRANADLSQVSDMAVNGNVFLTDANGNLSEYFQGKKQNFQIGAATPPIKITEVYARNGDKDIYVLDKTDGQIAKVDSNGQVVSLYKNTTFKNAVDFVVDEQGGKIYITDGTQVSSFLMNQ